MATAAASLHGHTVLPPEDLAGYQRLVALLAASDAAGDRTSGGSVFELTIRPATGGAPVAAAVIPPELFEVLIEVIDAMVAGRAVTISPLSRRLTTQEAAGLLGVSRPTLVKLLESGAIPFECPGRHRRVRLEDLLRYQKRQAEARRTGLKRLTQEAQETGLYDIGAEEYDEALDHVRHHKG